MTWASCLPNPTSASNLLHDIDDGRITDDLDLHLGIIVHKVDYQRAEKMIDGRRRRYPEGSGWAMPQFVDLCDGESDVVQRRRQMLENAQSYLRRPGTFAYTFIRRAVECGASSDRAGHVGKGSLSLRRLSVHDGCQTQNMRFLHAEVRRNRI